jgi:hypothetical protein
MTYIQSVCSGAAAHDALCVCGSLIYVYMYVCVLLNTMSAELYCAASISGVSDGASVDRGWMRVCRIQLQVSTHDETLSILVQNLHVSCDTRIWSYQTIGFASGA